MYAVIFISCTANIEEGRKQVTVGGLSESGFGAATVKTIKEEGLGTETVLFSGPWTPCKIEAVASYCRENGMKFVMDEIMDRRNKGVKKMYADSLSEVIEALKRNSDVLDGSLMMSEYGGVMFNWPLATIAGANRAVPATDTYGEAEEFIVSRMKEAIADAEELGIPRPYISIEPAPGTCACLLRGGIDRIDVEMIYGPETERRYAAASGASKAFGKDSFGVDNAMVWYGGEQHDRLWFDRWRTSLYHAFIRGADPIYAEHGLMKYKAFGVNLEGGHPYVREFRSILGEFAAWAGRHPRPEGLPKAAVAVLQGRHDGYVGGFQTHLWGQRTQDRFRIGYADDAWTILDGLYRRNLWEDRDMNGDDDYSGNPPLGMVDVLPYDAPDDVFDRYGTILILGRNIMDDALYRKLLRYVSGGGKLLLSAFHLDSTDSPGCGFLPYNSGDWSELTGLKVVEGRTDRMEYGIKFVENPDCGWKFHMYGAVCDPWFTDGGFRMPVFENVDADVLAIDSNTFLDSTLEGKRALLYGHAVGKGTVIFVPSIDAPGERGVRGFYEYLSRRAVEAVDSWPKVECSDKVRWSVYNDGTIYLLNTEYGLCSEVLLRMSPDSRPVRLKLKPGEIREIRS